MKKGILAAIFVLALLGVLVAAVSTSQHIRISKKGLEEASFCAISEKVNCDIVNASSYSEAFGVPVAWWGLTFYLLVAGIALYSFLSKKDHRPNISVAWFLSIGSIAYSAYYAYVSAVILGVICIECIAMYAVNIALVTLLFIPLNVPIGGVMRFFIDYAKAVFKKPSGLGFSPSVLKHAILVIVVFALGWVSIKALQADAMQGESKVSVDEKMNAHYMQSLYSLEPDPEWPVWGNPDAKVIVVEYSEFQCPFCKLAAFNIRPRLQEFKNDVRFYFVNFPLDSACNIEMEHSMHQWACMAAKAGICAQKNGDFWSYHDDLFRKQKELSDKVILDLAEKRGWNRDEFQACIDSPEVDARVKRDIASGRKIYVAGTPTVIVDDRKLKYWSDPKFLQEVVRKEIEEKAK